MQSGSDDTSGALPPAHAGEQACSSVLRTSRRTNSMPSNGSKVVRLADCGWMLVRARRSSYSPPCCGLSIDSMLTAPSWSDLVWSQREYGTPKSDAGNICTDFELRRSLEVLRKDYERYNLTPTSTPSPATILHGCGTNTSDVSSAVRSEFGSNILVFPSTASSGTRARALRTKAPPDPLLCGTFGVSLKDFIYPQVLSFPTAERTLGIRPFLSMVAWHWAQVKMRFTGAGTGRR